MSARLWLVRLGDWFDDAICRAFCAVLGHEWTKWGRFYRGGPKPYADDRVCLRCLKKEERDVVSPFDRITVPQARRHG